MLILNPILFIASGLIIGIMFFAARFFTSRSGKYYKAQQKNLGSLNGYVEEMVDGLKVVKVFNYEGKANQEFHKRNEEYRVAATNANFFAGGDHAGRDEPE